MKLKGAWSKLKNRILILLLAVGLPLCMMPSVPASAKTDSVDIYVGYFGDTYICLNTLTEAEMEANCECGEWAYSYIDNGAFTRYNLAYGAKLDQVLTYAGLNSIDDINWIYFTGTDEYSGQKGNTGFYNLLSVRRYFYPYLAVNWAQGDLDQSNSAVITSDREEVPTILAFEQSLTRDTEAFDYEKYKNAMSDDKCLRIVFGQTTWSEIDTSDSVYWVYAITITLKGSPIKVSEWDTEVGSSESLEELIKIDSGYEALDELIRNNRDYFTVTSNNPDVVRVNSDGTVTATGAGTAYLNVEYREGNDTLTEQIAVSATPGNGGGNDDGSQESVPNGGDDDGDGGGGGGSQESVPDGGGGDEVVDGGDSQGPTVPGIDNEDDGKGSGDGNDSGEGGLATGSGGKDEGDSSGTSDTPGSNPDGEDDADQGDGGAQGGGSNLGNGSGDEGDSDTGSGDSEGGGSDDQLGGEEGGLLSGSEDATGDSAGSAERIQEGMKTAEENVPLDATGEEVYDQVKDYIIEQLEDLDELPETGEITEFTEEVREYIQELIEQMQEDAEALDIDEIVEMVRQYIDDLAEEAEESEEGLSTEEHSGEEEAAKSVYLSVGNISGGSSTGGDMTTGANMSAGNTDGGSGGIVLEVEPLPFYYYVILIVVLAALFVGGGMYRSLRFRRETAER